MLRWLAALALAFFSVSASGCYDLGAGDDCPAETTECSGNSVVHATYVGSDECVRTETTIADCGARGGQCVNGGCVYPPPKNPCPGGKGECRGDFAFACQDGGLPDVGDV